MGGGGAAQLDEAVQEVGRGRGGGIVRDAPYGRNSDIRRGLGAVGDPNSLS